MIPGCPFPRSIKSMRAIRFWICSGDASLSSLSLSSSSSGGSTSLLPRVVRYTRSVYSPSPCSGFTRFSDARLKRGWGKGWGQTPPEAALAARLLRFTGSGSLVLLAAAVAVSALIEAAEPKPRGLLSQLLSD